MQLSFFQIFQCLFLGSDPPQDWLKEVQGRFSWQLQEYPSNQKLKTVVDLHGN